MKTTTVAFYLIVFILGMVSISCEKKAQPVPTADLEGKWTLLQAYRNGKETNTLENLYFHILDEERMGTNFFGRDEIWDIIIDEGKIIKMGGPDVEFLVIEHSNELLALSTEFQQFEFRFDLERAKDAED